jgi:hypothetical protein
VAGTKSKGRSRKTWNECVEHDLKSKHLKAEMAYDWNQWRGLIGESRPSRAIMEKTDDKRG